MADRRDGKDGPVGPVPRAGWWRTFLASDAAGGWVLVAAAGAALVWANGPWSSSYATVWLHPVRLGGSLLVGMTSVRSWVNGALMAVFFLVVGAEIGRERRTGELGTAAKAVVPVVAALGGMAGAGLVYAACVRGGPGRGGWGIPMATDIAFTLGALAVLGRRAAPGLRVFLLTLAVADDIGSVVVLAVWYHGPVRVLPLVAAVAVVGLTALVRRPLPSAAWPVLAGGAALWLLLAAGGVEPALAGVVAGVLVPSLGPDRAGRPDPAARLERRVAPVSAFAVLPLFALANAGITFHSGMLSAPGAGAVFVGVVVARVVGKLGGISGAAAAVAVRGRGRLPDGLGWGQLAGGAALAGIGFTVPLLIAEEAFAAHPALIDAAKLGLFAGSALAFCVGAAVIVRTPPHPAGSPAGGEPPPGGRPDGEDAVPW